MEGGIGDEEEDKVLMDEIEKNELELETFSGMAEEQWRDSHKEHDTNTPYGSDDEEYDDIFIDIIHEEIRTASQQEQDQQLQSHGLAQQQQRNHQERLEQEHSADLDMMDMS